MRAEVRRSLGVVNALDESCELPSYGKDFSNHVALAGDEISLDSPAQRLQNVLSWEYDDDTIEKWHPAKSLAFILLTCGGFWAGVAFLVIRAL